MSLPIDPTLSIEALETAIENHGYRITKTETDYPLYGWRNGVEGRREPLAIRNGLAW